MTFLLIFSSIVNLSLGTVAVIYVRKVVKLEKKLTYTKACLARADENNSRMLETIIATKEA